MGVNILESSQRASRNHIQDLVLTILDAGPSYGYEIIRQLGTKYGDLRLNTFYRWLSDMEQKNMVQSELLPGPHGPERRVYYITPLGRRRIKALLRDAIRLVLHVFDDFRWHAVNKLEDLFGLRKSEYVDGRVLYVPGFRLTDKDMQLLKLLSARNNGGFIEVLGDSTVLANSGFNIKYVNGTMFDIASTKNAFIEVWVNTMPDAEQWSFALQEWRRVLHEKGVLRIIVPHVFFEPPEEHGIEEFIRITAMHLFPELGIVEGRSFSRELEACFNEWGRVEIFPGLAMFWARKLPL